MSHPTTVGTHPAPTVPKSVAPVPPKAVAPKPPVGAATGLPVPRFAALRADEVNMRAGPGTQYPIEWVFKHQDMPVEIEREFDVWRLVEAPDGTKGWIHQATLIGTRTFFVPETASPLALRRSAADDAPVVATLEPGVIGRLVRCDPADAWCRVSVHGSDGYIPRASIWGLLPGEAVGMTP